MWSPVTSAASDDSSTSSGGDNEPLTINDIEKWHNRTTTINSRSSFNTDTSTLENTVEDYEQKGASGETTEGSIGSSDAEGDYNSRHDGNNYADDNRSSRQVVAGIPWQDNDGYEGIYTGEVNDDNIPDGLGLIRLDEGGEQEGEWRNGTLVRKKGVSPSNINALSTIEEEKSVKAPSIKYTDEFAHVLAAKQIGTEGEDTLQRRSSSNSMDANTTGENSNARDFADDAALYSSTSTRQSNLYSSTNSRKSHLYHESDSRKGHLYSSANSRHSSANSRSEQHKSPISKRSPDESTTFEGSDSDSDRNSISSGDNYIDYSYRNSQQTQNHHHEDLGLGAVEEEVEIDSNNRSSRARSGGNMRKGDSMIPIRPGEERKVQHETIDAIQQLMANNSNVEYDSEESSDDENGDDDATRSSAMFDWHTKDRRKSVESYFPGVVEDSDDDEMRPSMGTRLPDEQDENNERRESRRFSSISFKLGLDSDEDGNFRSKRWCYLFSACTILSIVGIALISWSMVRMRSKTAIDNNNANVPNSQSKDQDDSAGTKLSLAWETDVPCAPITIDLATDQYGNETTWALYRLAEVNNESKMLKATRASANEVGHKKRLRPVALSESNRKMEESINNGSQVRSGGPYTYMSDTGADFTSPVYTSSVCLPEGNYSFVISDVNGICCQYGLGQYSIFFNGGRTVRDASGVFTEKEITPFEVTSDDVLAALATANPSQSLSPSTPISPSASLSTTIVPSHSLVPPSPKLTAVSGNSSVSLNSAPQSPLPTLSDSTGAIYQPSSAPLVTGPQILTPTIAPLTTVSAPPTLSRSTGITSQPSETSLPVTVSPILSPTIAPTAVSPGLPVSASLAPTARITNITTIQPTTLTNNLIASSATIPPSSTLTSWPSHKPSFSPSQFSDTIQPTKSAIPTNFNPLLDAELLDSLSIPYTLSHTLTGETHTTTTSRRLQEERADSLYGFSTAVSADMSVLAVGATNTIDENGNHTGAVYLYSIDTSDAESIPTLLQVIYGSNPEDEFGNDVKLSDDGNRLVVAARSENEQEGAIRIYERTPGSNEWYVIRTIVGAGDGSRAGWSVAISGDGNVVAMGSTKGGSNDGGIVSTYIAPDWELYGPMIEAQTPRDVFGFSVSLNGDGTMIAVGSVKAANPDRVTNAGRAEVFSFNGTLWNSQIEVFGETKQAYVGSSVALSRDGNLFVVGGRGFTTDGDSAPAIGRCRIFERTGTGEYVLLSAIVGKNSREELGWSASVSADGNKVACGGKGGQMLDLGETGVARVWDRLSLVESEVLPRGERFLSINGASFGSSVSLSSDGSSLVVGASTWIGTAKASPAAGAVQMFGIGTQSVSTPAVSPTDDATVTSSPTTEIATPPTASAPLSALPTVFDPLLDVGFLDSLSSPFIMSRFLQGESDDSLYGFSTAVSADMSVLAVGATNAIDENGEHTGAVYLYSIDTSDAESIPTLLQVIYGSNPEDEFGNDVKLSDDGSRLVVAARSEQAQEGAIRMYNRRFADESGLWELSGTILGDGEGFRAGWSVAISGDGNVVAMGSTKGGSNEGGLVTTYIAPDWELHGSMIEAQTPRDVLGFSVSLNGDGTMIAVGSVKAANPDRVSNAGRAEVFSFDGTSWNSQIEVFGETKQAYDGSSVALSRDGNLFVVGGRGFTNDGGDTPAIGRCRIFERTGTGEYVLLSTIVGKNSREELGWSASISADGNKVACGGKGGQMLDFGGTGVARVWDRLSLVESEVLPRGEKFSSVKGASFGSSVSLSSDGSSLVVGAWHWNGAIDVTSPGGVFSFSMS